jgi:hypothetical protein
MIGIKVAGVVPVLQGYLATDGASGYLDSQLTNS